MLKVLLLDELLPENIQKAEDFLKLNTIKSPLNGLFWLILPREILTEHQLKFIENREVLKIAIEVSYKWIKFELLIKSEFLDNLGGGQLNKAQFQYVYDFFCRLADIIEEKTC
jgi:hypothetical protein